MVMWQRGIKRLDASNQEIKDQSQRFLNRLEKLGQRSSLQLFKAFMSEKIEIIINKIIPPPHSHGRQEVNSQGVQWNWGIIAIITVNFLITAFVPRYSNFCEE